jgi:hypothetical protein
MDFYFIIKISPNLLKNDVIIGDTFGVLFKVQMIWHNFLKKLEGG